MKQIDKIRALLDEIETEIGSLDDQAFTENFNSLELPDLICSVVDFLQPSLYPYEAAVYWHLFRQSILASGTQYTRTSVRSMMQGVITSSSGQSNGLSYGAVQKALQGLEGKRAISKPGDTNREGTLYKIHLPEEIPSCQELMKQAQELESVQIDPKKEFDFYNVRENRIKVFGRDEYKCHYCGKQLTRFTATLDHIQPVSEGGDNSYDNLVTACLHCNSQRGSRPVMDIIVEKNSQHVSSADTKKPHR
ncbi:MAG: HNH endonuclease [Deltaproteobacteria bacterium]|nr:HNH endonuclease [Deltaproteobacteria bacterium]MBW2011089.1 HNH endonuclease [Deltaproteobacteria bacterium]MBW2099474.1 HNH endonuclease [Deltaproteobacteria bacterium]